MVAKETATAPIDAAAEQGGESPEANPLAIVRSEDPPPPPPPPPRQISAESTRKEEVESKITAWEAEEVARITNRFQRQKAIIDGWEGEQVDSANAWLKKIERKLEEKRAKALEKMQNEVAVARQKADERKAEAEAKREEKLGKVMDIARVMKVFGRDPSKRSFFKP
ncbi:remorin 4.1-like [Dendrobium catenatum]|uniref:remorin 4.1-like n=1 Tax=Dendrobium catenatum TaxID=906689 RepID=UPI0009F206D7|nr:remorin 4.1-like [Dendrobium catenatum]